MSDTRRVIRRFALTWLAWTGVVYAIAAVLLVAGTATGNWGPGVWDYTFEVTVSILFGRWALWTAFLMALAGLTLAVIWYAAHQE